MQLIYEKSVAGRRGVMLPKSDVPPAAALPQNLLRSGKTSTLYHFKFR